MIVSMLVVHHSASSRATTTKKTIEKWHKARGFKEIGYHKLIDGTGKVIDGRSELKVGAHAKGANSNSLGVCLAGNFETESPTGAQIKALVDVLTAWCKKYKISEAAIHGHGSVPGGTTKTKCPGKTLASELSGVKASVRTRLNRKTAT